MADYAQVLAADLGSPPDPARARALAQRLPIAVHITGPLVQLETHPSRFDRRADRHFDRSHGTDSDLRPGFLTVQRPDGHRISFALVAPPDAERPRLLGWATLAAWLVLTALAYAAVRRQLQPIQDISTGVQAFGSGRFETPIRVRKPDELGELAVRINTMAHSLDGMLDAKRALLLAMSHELRSPLTRARVIAELLEDSRERQALLRDLRDMRDQITALLEGERLADGHRALHIESDDLAALAAGRPDPTAPVAAQLAAKRTPPWHCQQPRRPAGTRTLFASRSRRPHGAGGARPRAGCTARTTAPAGAGFLPSRQCAHAQQRGRRPGPVSVPAGGPNPRRRAAHRQRPPGAAGGDGLVARRAQAAPGGSPVSPCGRRAAATAAAAAASTSARLVGSGTVPCSAKGGSTPRCEPASTRVLNTPEATLCAALPPLPARVGGTQGPLASEPSMLQVSHW